jgi:hypothetical protein
LYFLVGELRVVIRIGYQGCSRLGIFRIEVRVAREFTAGIGDL